MEPVGVLPKLAALTALHRAAALAIRKCDEAREAQEHALFAAFLTVLGAGTCNAKLSGCTIEAAPGKLPEIVALMRNLLPAPIFFALFSPPFSPLMHASMLTTKNSESPSIGEQLIRSVYLCIIAGEDWPQVLKVLPHMPASKARTLLACIQARMLLTTSALTSNVSRVR